MGTGESVVVAIAVSVGAGMFVGIDVYVGVSVGVAVVVGVAVSVSAGAMVAVSVSVGVGVSVGTSVSVGVSLGVSEGVGVSDADCARAAPAENMPERSTLAIIGIDRMMRSLPRDRRSGVECIKAPARCAPQLKIYGSRQMCSVGKLSLLQFYTSFGDL